MHHRTTLLCAALGLALTTHAQVYNWTLATDAGTGTPANSGSGQLTVTGGVVTAMSGSFGGNAVSLIPPGGYWGNDNALPLTYDGVAFNAGTGPLSVFVNLGVTYWINGQSFGGPNADGSTATFTYTPVPEPSTWAAASVFGGVALVTVGVRRRKALRSAGTAV